jgi:hypothetical protein
MIERTKQIGIVIIGMYIYNWLQFLSCKIINTWTIEDTKILCIFVCILLVSFGWIPFVNWKDKKKTK